MIEVRNIHKSFGRLEVLRGISIDIQEHEIVAIVGPSGAGKTTLLQIMGTLETPDMGSVVFDGCDVTRLRGNSIANFRNNHIGFVFQFHRLLPEFSALENILIPAYIANRPHIEAEREARNLLDLMGLSSRAGHKPAELSGGECQRIAVARALINNPKVVFADEPSGSLDSQNKDELHNLFFRLRDQLGITFVVITHDKELAGLSDRTITLIDGLVVEG